MTDNTAPLNEDIVQIGTSPVEDFEHTELVRDYEFDVCVFIGRFQPFHNGHYRVVMNALEKSEKLLILIGSEKTSATPKNLFDYDTRRTLIYKAIDSKYHPRLEIKPLRDYMYNDTTWLAAVQAKVNYPGKRIAITGCFKDDGSWYLNSFPDWTLLAQEKYYGLDATDVRKLMFEGFDTNWQGLVPKEVARFLSDYIKTSQFKDIQAEYKFVEDYKKQWEVAPYPPTFVTTDAVVTKDGHVLVVERGFNPGKGKLALPGGFVNVTERIEDAAIRELYEETDLDVPKAITKSSLKDKEVFDHPLRSTRGRTITNAFHYNLDEYKKGLPIVQGLDDASDAFWLEISEASEREADFYEDHWHIIDYFVRRI